MLGYNSHGKGRVRIVKVVRKDDFHTIMQLNVTIALEGDSMDEVFTDGNNSKVVATDTCKNTVYVLGKTHSFESIEDFGLIIVNHFLKEYPKIVNRVTVEIVKDNWERILCPDSNNIVTEHNHAFKRIGPMKTFASVVGEKRISTPLKVSVQSGIRGLDLLKTTQSAFVGFLRDKFTTLPEVNDRLFGTSVDAKWDFSNATILQKPDFNQITEEVIDALVGTFAGPADVGVFSPSVQQTLFEMGQAALAVHPAILKITLQMPNIHNLPFPLENLGLSNKDHTGNPDIFFPIDEPHGMIKAEVLRAPNSML